MEKKPTLSWIMWDVNCLNESVLQSWSATVLKPKNHHFKHSAVALHSTPLVCTQQLNFVKNSLCVPRNTVSVGTFIYITWNQYSLRPEVQFGRMVCHFNFFGIHSVVVYQIKTDIRQPQKSSISSINTYYMFRSCRPSSGI